MKLIFVHHGKREFGNPPGKDDDLTELGYEDARLTAKLLKDIKINAVYTSPYFRCKRTAEILNFGRKLPLYEDDRLNEFGKWNPETGGETWVMLQERVMQAIKDVASKYEEDSAVVFVTSGVNVVGFLNIVYKCQPREDAPFVGIPSCSPLIFEVEKSAVQQV